MGVVVRDVIAASPPGSGYEWESEAFQSAGSKMGAEFDAYYVGVLAPLCGRAQLCATVVVGIMRT